MRLFVLLLLLASCAIAEPVRHLGHDAFRVGLRFEDALLAPDGGTFALVAYPGLFLLDACSGQVVQHWEFSEPIDRVAFDPQGRLLVFDRSGWLRTLDPRTGRVLRSQMLPEHGLSKSVFHATGRVLTVSRNVRVEQPRQVENSRFVGVELGQSLGWAEDLWIDQRWALSADGERLAVARNRPCLTPLLKQIGDPAVVEQMHHLLRVVDTTTGRELYQRRYPKEEVYTLTFTPDGQKLIATLYPRVLLIDLKTGSERELKLAGRPPERGFTDPFVISSDGKRLACCESECAPARTVVHEWDLETGRLLVRHVAEGVTQMRIGYGARDRLLVWNTHGCRLDVIDPHVGPILPGVGPAVPLYQIVFTPDGRQLVTLDEENHVCRWDAASGRLCAQVDLPSQLVHPDGFSESVETTQLTRNGESVALVSRSLMASLDLASRQLGDVKQLGVRGGMCSPDGRWFVVAGDDEQAASRVVDLRSGRSRSLPELQGLWPGGSRGGMPVFSPDGRLLVELLVRPDAARSQLGAACLVFHKSAGGGVLARSEMPITEIPGPLLFAPDGRALFVGHDGKVSRFEANSGRLLGILNPPTAEGHLMPLATSPDGRLHLVLASATRHAHGGELQLIELLTGSVRKRWFWAQSRPSSAMPLFSPDGRTIAMPRDDGTVVLLTTASESSPPDRAMLWQDLASPDAALAGAAVESLASRSNAVGWIRERLGDVATHPDLPAQFWLAELEHDDYDRREAARRELARRPDRLEELEAALVGPLSPNMAQTLAQLREDRIASPTADERRRTRLREVLDRVATPARPPTP